MANIAYIKITGKTQGEITSEASTDKSIGNIWQEGHEGESIVYAFESNAIVPRDPNSGTAIGTRRHEPATFLKPLDKASPLLWQALATGENLDVELKFFRTATDGKQQHYYTIKWTDAVLVGGKVILPDTNDAANDSRGHQEQWSFTYRQCDWTHEVAGTSASDDWRKPAV
ncbi:type VI secretion system secreted protein Hcp [Pseudorhizobium tarimense]|uniref:Type VI secretion system secreted protein Hcp n=1 Tax=Pseudorhizobium tarimense TaxID=1079109 RepID=A0ABV2H467_9HYPH|nr:Hcp family type VI secretion system effector [Pseudorhizobium tarimense]MCJ8518570.1 Hcp family type VI secretion system effector [Pseudorhizobium tarimense]